ncbi:MAG: DUF362 domain-containing protein, partial [Pseudomonadota bacterium]
FMKAVIALGFGGVFTSTFAPLSRHIPILEAMEPVPDLVVAHGSPPSRVTEAAVEALGGMKSFVSRGDVVFLKPNMSWDRVPEQAATTNPEVVQKIVEMCLAAGAKTVKVSDNTLNDPRRCFVRSGVAQAVNQVGGKAFYMDERKFKEVDIKGDVITLWPVYIDVLEADKIINIPIAKHHSLTLLTMGMKNWIGAVGGRRNILHQKIHACIVDLARFFRPTLTILDAIRVLTKHGPQGGGMGDVKRMDTIVAGIDQVAVDSYGATLFGLEGADLEYVRLAHRLGVGTMTYRSMTIKKLEIG